MILVIMGLVPDSMALAKHSFVDNQIILIASPQHALAKRKNIPLKELAEHAFIHREKGSGTRQST